MKKTRILILAALFFPLMSCGLNFNRHATTQHCSKILSSSERADCYSRTSDFNERLQDRMDREKAEEREKEKVDLDFGKGKESSKDETGETEQ